jgi:cell division protein FtsL
MKTRLRIIQAIVSTRLREVAERHDIDVNDAGFTTVEKVVLTALAVGIAVVAGGLISTKVSSIISKIEG